ncbi:hypothetical protein C9374_008642 [Naegleria lovaniensis]|uniref:Uncharacterized protein n=1 Tax=Naegleria lovaniensis TaxID=51637 RepID=A0AA88GJM7_NAELO|nr:uncharacterized protein C9374_008642 [Naegleria lovaniensis]KAG2378020.1 hypothetical protein C9374_008642 [Naegleria lovaniensis]
MPQNHSTSSSQSQQQLLPPPLHPTLTAALTNLSQQPQPRISFSPMGNLFGSEEDDALNREQLFLNSGLLSNLAYVQRCFDQQYYLYPINIEDVFKKNALHHACKWGNTHIVKYLISKGISINAKDSNGNTPLHLSCEEGYLEIVKLLISHPSIKIYLKNKDFQTPRRKAQVAGHDCVLSLIDKFMGNVNLMKDNLKNQVIDRDAYYSNYKLSDIDVLITSKY